MVQPFTYDKLHDPTKDIRLLQIKGACVLDNDFTVKCELHRVRPNEHSSYVAVSYTWGPAEPAKRIIVNKHEYKVRPNLWSLLMQLHRHREANPDVDRPEFFWIDFLCINQSDNDKNKQEKADQINQMKTIFQKAESVFVWLGEGSEYAFWAMGYLSGITDLVYQKDLSRDRSSRRSARFSTLLKEKQQGMDIDPQELKAFDRHHLCFDPPFPKTVAQGLLCLFEASYWRRVWILQEIFLATDLRLLYGSRTVEWFELETFLSEIETLRVGRWPFPDTEMWSGEILKTPAHQVILERQQFRENPVGRPMTSLITRFWNRECTNRREIIYGLLGLCSDDLKADYTQNRKTICKELVQLAWRTGQLENQQEVREYWKFLVGVLGSPRSVNESQLSPSPPLVSSLRKRV
ncbi:heterokaryon incompatibility protein-domain-containing protein [Hypoxylon fuscum]|nr:heterokaryon incompatibility protein-domain-containing protein [Hypoxylon fuscum]